MSEFGRLARGLGVGLAMAALSAPAIAHECEIVLGAAISLTGAHAAGGLHRKNGYDFAVDRLNEAGGIEVGDRTCTMRLVYYDDGSSPARAAELAEGLILQDKVQYLLGPHGAAAGAAVAAVAEKHAIPMVAAGDVGRALLDRGYRQLFAVASAPGRFLGPVADLAVELARAESRQPEEVRVALAFATDPFSRELRAGLLEALESHGIESVIDGSLPDELADMGAILAEVKALGPDLLVVSGREKGAATAVRQIAEAGVTVPMIAITHCEAAAVIADFGRAANGILCPTSWAPALGYSDEVFGSAAEYAEAFRTAYPDHANREVSQAAAEASAAVLAFADAFRRARTLEAEAVREALAETEMTTFYGPVSFSPNGRNTIRPTLIRQIQDGAYAVVAPRELATGELRYPRP